MTRSASRPRRLASLGLAVALAVLAGEAGAAEVKSVSILGGGRTLTLAGIIEPGDDAKIVSALAEDPRPTGIDLASLGGNVQAALSIGAAVRRAGLKTGVPARGICASACGLVWLAGTPRTLGREAHVGLHAAYLRRNGISVETGAANALIGAYLARLGFEDRAIVYLTSAAPDDMTWILAADRQRYGIAFESSDAPILASAPVAEDRFLARPLAMAGAIASAAVAAVDRLMGRDAAAVTSR